MELREREIRMEGYDTTTRLNDLYEQLALRALGSGFVLYYITESARRAHKKAK